MIVSKIEKLENDIYRLKIYAYGVVIFRDIYESLEKANSEKRNFINQYRKDFFVIYSSFLLNEMVCKN